MQSLQFLRTRQEAVLYDLAFLPAKRVNVPFTPGQSKSATSINYIL